MVADAAPERACALAARYGARAVTVSEAIHSDAIDAVLIASSTPSHAELLEAAAVAGKAVYCEKPIDLSWRAPVRWWSGCSPERAGHCRL